MSNFLTKIFTWEGKCIRILNTYTLFPSFEFQPSLPSEEPMNFKTQSQPSLRLVNTYAQIPVLS